MTRLHEKVALITGGVVGLTSDAGICAYATAKHAQVGLMRTAAKEMASRGIRVNTLHPGPTTTDFQRAISSGQAWRPSGMRASKMRAARSGGAPVADVSIACWNSVLVGPGCSVLTRMPRLAISLAAVRMRPIWACLAVA